LPGALAACLMLLIASARAGEQQQGAELAATCASCHGPAGSAQGIPSLAGLDEYRILSAMAGYRMRESPNHIMHAVALSLSDEELKRVARYLAQQTKEAKPK
jgi:cytochrome subunit of sulfide dehydrogenase